MMRHPHHSEFVYFIKVIFLVKEASFLLTCSSVAISIQVSAEDVLTLLALSIVQRKKGGGYEENKMNSNE